MNQEFYQDRIEKYIDGQLSGNELESFQKELSTNKNLAADVQLHTELREAMTEREVTSFEDGLKDLFKEAEEEVEQTDSVTKIQQKQKQPAKVFSLRRALAVAASVLFLAVAGVVLYQSQIDNNSSNSYASIINKHIDLPSTSSEVINPNSTRSDDIDTKKVKKIQALWQSFTSNYDTEKFDDAIGLITEIETLDPNGDYILEPQLSYFKGIIFLKKGQAQKAYDAFDEVEFNDAKYGENSLWYKAIAGLLTEDEEKVNEAKETIEFISNKSDHPKSNAAQQLLNEIGEK